MWLRAAAAFAVLCIGGAPAWSACNPPGASGFPAGGTRLDTQTKDSVSLTGGCIDGIPIGQNTPAAATFTDFTLPGGSITLTGNLVTGGALTTTGTGPTTLAFPDSTATYTYPSASTTLMDNAAGNSSLPDARTNLGLGTASTPSFAALFLTATDPVMTAFVPPGYGGSWTANSIFSTTGTATHAGVSRSTVNINRTTSGSGQNGPDSSDIGLFVTIGKTDWLTSTVDGEIDAVYIQSSQGLHGDGGALMAGAFKVRGGTGGIVPMEISTRWVNSGGDHFMDTHMAVGFAPGTGDISNNTAHGYFAGNYGPSVALAASKVDPYSAFTSMDRDIYGTCPANCSFWQNFLTATANVNDEEVIFFQVKAGPTSAGDIMQGSGVSTLWGVPTQSSGLRITTKNVGGDWRLYAHDGTTVFKQTQQSISGGGVSDRLNGPNPTSLWRDTGVAFNAGGLHRLTFSGGVGYWQTNTAAGGDFSSAGTPYSISTAGVMTLNSPTLVTPYLGAATAASVATSGPFRAAGNESDQFQIANGGQEWRLNGQTAGAGGLFYLYDVTNGRFPFTVAPNSVVSLTMGPTNATIAGGTLTGLPAPSAASDAVPKSYADSIAAGIVTHAAVAAATTANLTATASGTGPGKTLTNSGAQAAFSTDGYAGLINDRILVKNQTLSQNNGIYTLTTVGTGATNWVLTRATDFDAASAAEVAAGASAIVISGTTLAASNWVETGQGPFTLETTPIVFSQVVGGSSSGTVATGTGGQLGYYAANGTTISGVTNGNNGVLITSAGGVPSINSTLPSAVQGNITATGTIATGVWSGTAVGVSKGGTGADLGATGGAGQVLKQASIGATVTVGALSCADLSNDAASCATDATNATNITSGTLPLAQVPTIPTSNFSTTATNDNAAAGKLGEVLSATGTAVAVTSTTQTNITSRALTPGDWDVSANIKFNPAATTTSTVRAGGLSLTSATLPANISVSESLARETGAITAGQGGWAATLATVRVSTAGTPTVYCVGRFTFATSTATADCVIYARRVR